MKLPGETLSARSLLLGAAGVTMLSGAFHFSNISDPIRVSVLKAVGRENPPTRLEAAGVRSGESSPGIEEPEPVRVAAVLLEAQTSPSNNPWTDLLSNLAMEHDPQRKEDLITSLLDQLPSAQFQPALDALHSLPASDGREELSLRLVRSWSLHDPAAAGAWAATLPPTEGVKAVAEVAGIWANHNLPASLEWARRLPEPGLALVLIAGEAVRSDPQTALRIAIELPQDAASDELIQRATADWAAEEPAAVIAWARQLPKASPLRARIIAGVALVQAETNAAAAARLALTDLPVGRLQQDTVIGILQRWAQTDPEQAAQWLGQFPPGELKNVAVENVAAIWTMSDQIRSSQWRNQMAGTFGRSVRR